MQQYQQGNPPSSFHPTAPSAPAGASSAGSGYAAPTPQSSDAGQSTSFGSAAGSAAPNAEHTISFPSPTAFSNEAGNGEGGHPFPGSQYQNNYPASAPATQTQKQAPANPAASLAGFGQQTSVFPQAAPGFSGNTSNSGSDNNSYQPGQFPAQPGPTGQPQSQQQPTSQQPDFFGAPAGYAAGNAGAATNYFPQPGHPQALNSGQYAPQSFGAGMTAGPAARAEHLSKVYGEGDAAVVALRDINLTFQQREFTAIMGPSGSGKSTLMHCMAGLDRASGGGAFVGDVNLSELTDKQTTALRRDRLGFIFQSFNLVPTLTAQENITLPSDVAGREVDQDWFNEVVTRLGLVDRLEHRPAELSGGQQQRVACARALVSRPELIFGDEPTGNLDSNSSREVLQILRDAVDYFQQTVVIVTHDPKAASYADRVVFLADGHIVAELREPNSDAVLAMMAQIEKRY